MKSTENKESVLVLALAEHLLGKLSPGEQYRCGCDTEICFGATGIGHADVWHGFVDIMMTSSDHKPESIASVYLALNNEGPSPNKKMKTSG
ncbi:hypothetical protein AM593_05122, partial [Mytilus galloprovincialis]